MERNKNSKEMEIDVKVFFEKIFKRWYWFALSLLITLFIGYGYLKIKEPIYQVSSSILLKDGLSGGVSPENILQGFEVFSGKKNLDNEIGILKSYTLSRKVIKELNFNVSYFTNNGLRNIERYRDLPFVVIVDTTHIQLLNLPIEIKLLSDGKLHVKAKGNEINIFDYQKEKLLPLKIDRYSLDTVLFWGQNYSDKYLSFKVYKSNSEENQSSSFGTYFFKFNDIKRLAENYREKLSVLAISKQASIVELSLEGPVVRKEVDYLNKLSELYIENDLSEKNRISTNTIQFIDRQLNDVVDSLSIAEDALQNFRLHNKSIDLSYEARNVFDNLKSLEELKAQEEVKEKYYDYLLGYVQNTQEIDKLVAPSSIGIQDPLLNGLINQLTNLYSEKAALGYSVDFNNPYYSILLLKIENAKKALVENVVNIKASSEISLDNVKKRIESVEASMNKLPLNERKLIDIQRRFNLNDNIYNYLLQKRAEAGIVKASNISDSRIIDYAKVHGYEPKSPKAILVYVVAIFFGLLIPFLTIVINEIFNDRILSRHDIKKHFDIPVLGVIRHFSNSRKFNPNISDPKSPFVESFRSLRVNLQYVAPDKNYKVIGVTSTVSGEGKTFCALNLAIGLANSNKKTLLLLADLRRPKVYKSIGLHNQMGLSNYLINQVDIDDIIQQSTIKSLDAISSGPIPPNSMELLSLPKMDQLFERLRDTYDAIVIDSPPVGIVSDYLVLAKFIEVNLYIVRYNYTQVKDLLDINELYVNNKIKNLYAVLNDVPTSFKYTYYGYEHNHNGTALSKATARFTKLFRKEEFEKVL